MRISVIVAVVFMFWMGQGRAGGDGKTTEVSKDLVEEDEDDTSVKKDFHKTASAPQPPAKPKEDDGDDSSDEVDDDPNALDDEYCDELWVQTKKEDEKKSPDEIVEWTNLCAMKHGLCLLRDPYCSYEFIYNTFLFGYKHDFLKIKSKVTTAFSERCSNPAVDWEKVGEKYRPKDQKLRRYAKPSKSTDRRRHWRRSKSAIPK